LTWSTPQNTEFAKGIVGDVTRTVWSHSDDATIFGGYGGFVEPGWNNVEVRLMTVAKLAANGTYSYKPIKNAITGDSAYILQTEQYIFPGKSLIDIRATIICQKEPEGWKIIHRHGEIIKTPQ
jgi:ketosteroid isomerase-like protein